METGSWLPHPTHSSAREGCLEFKAMHLSIDQWLAGRGRCNAPRQSPPAYQRPSLHQESKVKRQKGAKLAAEIAKVVTGKWLLYGGWLTLGPAYMSFPTRPDSQSTHGWLSWSQASRRGGRRGSARAPADLLLFAGASVMCSWSPVAGGGGGGRGWLVNQACGFPRTMMGK